MSHALFEVVDGIDYGFMASRHHPEDRRVLKFIIAIS